MKPLFDHRLPVVAGAFMTQFMVIGLLFSYALFFKVFETEFGWSRTLVSSVSSLSFIIMGAGAFWGGRLSDRFGPRIVLSLAGLMCGIGYMSLSQVSAPWHLFAFFGLLTGIGMSTHDVVTLSTIARWFDAKRGIMTAVVKVGTASGQFILPPVAAFLMVVFGWKSTTIILGLVAVVVLLGAAGLMKSPQTKTFHGEVKNVAGHSYLQARASHVLWMLCAIQFLFFPTMMTIPLHIVVHGMDLGLTATVAATLLSTMAAASIAGRLMIGLMFDRLGGKTALVLCFIPLILSLIAMMFIAKPIVLFAIIVVYGFAHGGFFTVVSPTIAQYFGLRAHGQLFGLVLFFGAISGAAGPFIAGWIFDTNGSYFWAFGLLAGMAALGLILTVLLPNAAKFGKDGLLDGKAESAVL